MHNNDFYWDKQILKFITIFYESQLNTFKQCNLEGILIYCCWLKLYIQKSNYLYSILWLDKLYRFTCFVLWKYKNNVWWFYSINLLWILLMNLILFVKPYSILIKEYWILKGDSLNLNIFNYCPTVRLNWHKQ